MKFFHSILHPAVPKYDFHIIKIIHYFIFMTFQGFITNQLNDLEAASMAKRVEHWSSNLEAPSLGPTLTAGWI